MPKQALESLTESMFYLLMALTQGERCGTEITAFAAEITAGPGPAGAGHAVYPAGQV